MKIVIETTGVYTPSWNNNKEEDKPIVFYHLEPTLALYNSLVPKPSVTMKFDSNMSVDGGETIATVDNTKFVKKMITKIENLSYEKEGKEYKITDANDLLGPGVPAIFAGLVDEVGGHLQSLLTKREVDAKN